MDYHLYLLSTDDRIQRRVDLDCQDDEHAIAVITEGIAHQSMELWQGERLVTKFRASPD